MAVIDRERWRVLEPLLDRALDMPDDERATWLDSLRTETPALAAELSAILAEDAAADRRGFLAESPRMSLEGLEVGAYTLERPLGHGGMGSVWLARRTDGRFEGHAAVKLMNLALVSPTGQERFRREGTMLARLGHPGIARLLDAGVAPTGQPYLVIEHIAGERIDAFASARALSRDERIQLVLQVLDAVGHAHANLIIHRDIKPSNILVTADGTVKLLDFGIAKLVESDETDARTALTADGGRAFTPEFASPEQVQGGTVTTATDVYALGALLHLLLSGRHPTADGCRTPAEAIRAVLEVEPARLGLGDLDTILAKALRKAPHERYQTVAVFADDLRRYLREEPVSARPDSLTYRARKFVRRNRAAVATAAVVAATLVISTVFSISQMHEARRQRDEAVRAVRRTQAFADLQRILASDSRGADGRPLSGAERVAVAERVLVRQFSAEPWLVAEVMTQLATRFYESGERDSQRQMLARARAIARAADLPQQVAYANCERVYSFAYDDVFDSARTDLAEAKAALARAGESVEPHLRLNCLAAEGKLMVAMGQSDSGVALLTRAVSRVGAEPANLIGRLSITNDLAEVLRLSQRMREAVPYQRQVLEEVDAAGYAETELLPNVLTFLAASLWELGEAAEAEAAVHRFVREREAVNGPGVVPSLLAFTHGQMKLRLGELDSADLWVGRALRDTTEGAGALANALPATLAQLRLDQGRIAEARQAVAQLPSGTRGRRATAALLRSRLRRAEGDSSGALALLESELRTLSSDGKQSLTLFAIPFVTAGEMRLAAGDARGADSLARLGRAAAAVDSMALTRSVFVGRAELLRARALRALGDAPGALAAARRGSVAMAGGYGPAHRWARAAEALVDSLSR